MFENTYIFLTIFMNINNFGFKIIRCINKNFEMIEIQFSLIFILSPLNS